MSSLSNEPSYIDGKVNPIFKGSDGYEPVIVMVKKAGLDDGLPPLAHEHVFVTLDDEDIGISVQCTICGMGKILPRQ